MFDNVSDTPKEQFHERGQALSPKSIPLDIASTPRSHRYCVIASEMAAEEIPQTVCTQTFIQTGIIYIQFFQHRSHRYNFKY